MGQQGSLALARAQFDRDAADWTDRRRTEPGRCGWRFRCTRRQSRATASEPKWVGLRPYREGADKRDAKFTKLAADFAAAIRGMPKEDLLSQEVRQQRRALRLAVGAAVSLLVLAVAATAAGILAYREQQEAITQRNRAEATLAAATQTANSLVFDLADRFRDAVGVPASLIKDILDKARALQEQAVKSELSSPDFALLNPGYKLLRVAAP